MDAWIRQKKIIPKENDGGHLPAAPHGCYKCKGEENWCVIAVYNEDEWENFCRILGNIGWTKEERFSTLSLRKKNKGELDKHIETWTSMQSADLLVQLLQEAGISAGLVQDAESLANDSQLQARNFFTPIHHPVYGQSMTEKSPIRFMDNSCPASFRASPLLGTDDRYVYEELLGLSNKKIQSYKKRGIIA
jgi:crotonobetainyl-CoA:carnitine CoA-transferase CaiB-like acyl-CoA transferase